MTATELLPLLDGVRTRDSGKWLSRCPAHQDKSPSLRIAEGERGLLLKCWAGCTLEEITGALHVSVKDLFFDTLGTDSDERRQAMEQRRQAKAKEQAVYGRKASVWMPCEKPKRSFTPRAVFRLRSGQTTNSTPHWIG